MISRHRQGLACFEVVCASLLAILMLLGGTRSFAEIRDQDFLDKIRVGHWIEVRGQLTTDGSFEAERIEGMSPRRAASIWGVATVLRPGVLQVLGRKVLIDEQTSWRGGDADAADGQRVRARGQLDSRGRLVAQRIEIRDPGVERIAGRVDRVHNDDNGLELAILGFDILVQPQARQRLEKPLAELDRVPPYLPGTGIFGAIDPEDRLGNGFRFSPSTHLALHQDATYSSSENVELDERSDLDDEDRRDTAHNLRARLTWTPSSRVMAVVDARHRLRRREEPGINSSSTEGRTRLAEGFVLFRNIGLGLDLQAGRQDFDDPREWLYDQNLDALRLFRQTKHLHLELSLSTTLDDGSSRDEDATNVIAYVSNRSPRRHLAGYLIDRSFSERAERQRHWGVRALGSLTNRFEGWAELSFLEGQRSGRQVEAWGGDIGLKWRPPGRRRFTMTAGLAYGSGEDGGPTDNRFRQTGLQDNNARLGGLTAIRYYGELVDPELSNLWISTLGIGARITRSISVELVGHTYRQDHAATRLTRTRLDRRPNGLDPDLGWELDLIVGVRRWARWDLEIVGARFAPGKAFFDPARGDNGDGATRFVIQLRYRH